MQPDVQWPRRYVTLWRDVRAIFTTDTDVNDAIHRVAVSTRSRRVRFCHFPPPRTFSLSACSPARRFPGGNVRFSRVFPRPPGARHTIAWLREFRRNRTNTGARPGRPRGLIFNPAPPAATIPSLLLPSGSPSPLSLSLSLSRFVLNFPELASDSIAAPPTSQPLPSRQQPSRFHFPSIICGSYHEGTIRKKKA